MRRKLSAPWLMLQKTSPTERTPGNAKSLLARHSPRSVPADGGSPSTCNVPGRATVEGKRSAKTPYICRRTEAVLAFFSRRGARDGQQRIRALAEFHSDKFPLFEDQ